MRILYKKHAEQQRIERGISKELIETAIKRGAKQIEGKKIVVRYSYIDVVYIKTGNTYWIITVMIRK